LLPKALRKEFQTGHHLEALKSFRRECWAFGLTATEGLEDLAVAQHYGLATNLLDWSTNPLVALFFACGEEYDKDGTALGGDVFVLNNPEPVGEQDIKGDKWRDIKGLKLYNPRLIDPRITRQKGLFTIQGVADKTVKDLVSPPELITHFVPAELKLVLLEILYTMGIDRSTLFPDPDGLCARINWETKNRIKRDFPPVSGDRIIYAKSHGAIGHGDTKAEFEIAPDLATATEAVSPLDDEQASALMRRVEAELKTAAVAHPRMRDPQQEKELRLAIGYDLEILEKLTSIAEKLPSAAIKESWEIVSRNVIKTARIFGDTRVEGGGSDLHQAVYYLSINVLESQEFMISMYALATVFQKVEKNPNADVSAKDAQVFVRSCMTVLSRLLSSLPFEGDR